MARLRIFVSSTCYDLDILRSELRPFIVEMGYDPVMSDYSDVLYDPRSHTHDSCIKEVPSCEMVILIIGSRFGGTAVPSVFANIDFQMLEQLSTKADILENKERLSITQLEVLKAVEQSIPVYTFVDDKVLHDHNVYEKNKDKKDIIDNIDFPSIQKRETAKYIFEFINFLSHRVRNNSIIGFSRLDEIRTHLTSQWSQLFQRLVSESRMHTQEARRYRDFSERIDDLKALVLASLTTPDLRAIAKGAIQYRHLIGFISSFHSINHRDILLSQKSWDEVFAAAGVVETRILSEEGRLFRPDIFLILNDGTFYRCRYPRQAFEEFRIDWGTFINLEKDNRIAIVDALLEDRETRRFPAVQHIDKNIDEFLNERGAHKQLDPGDHS